MMLILERIAKLGAMQISCEPWSKQFIKLLIRTIPIYYLQLELWHRTTRLIRTSIPYVYAELQRRIEELY